MIESLQTLHHRLRLPAFFPDATRAVARSVGSDDLAACGVQGVMVNIFHLLSRPGIRAITEHGGIHKFMNWHQVVATDSGGFQAYSLLESSPKLGSISAKGFTYRLQTGGDKIILTPEKCIQTQFRLGADLMFCLDYCTHPQSGSPIQQRSVELTVSWARKCRATYDSLVEQKQLPADQRPKLFAVIQGGDDPHLRRRCAEQLQEIGFDGYAYGGWPITANGRLADSLAQVAELTPPDLPRFGLGIGKPETLAAAYRLGYRLFDCVIPTRDARRQRLYVFADSPSPGVPNGKDFYHCLYLQDKKHAHDNQPVELGCDCLCCRSHSRAYLHHLFKIRDGLAQRLATIHNLTFYRRLLSALATPREME